MKIVHRALFESRRAANELLALGVQVEKPSANVPYYLVRITEDDPLWPRVATIVGSQRARTIDHPTTEFSEEERNATDVLVVTATSQVGFPQPERDFGFLQATYALEDFCGRCKAGRRQENPFRLARAPRFGKGRSIVQLNWVLDELFVSPEVWGDVFRVHGVECWPVMDHKSGERLSEVVQLRIEGRTPVILGPYDTSRSCPKCGSFIYELSGRGFLPRPRRIPCALFRSAERFTDGGVNLLFATSAMYSDMIGGGLKGLQFSPCSKPA